MPVKFATLRLSNLKTRTGIKAKVSALDVCVEAIMYLLLYNWHDCIFEHVDREYRDLPL